jgi:hypothetical protein
VVRPCLVAVVAADPSDPSAPPDAAHVDLPARLAPHRSGRRTRVRTRPVVHDHDRVRRRGRRCRPEKRHPVGVGRRGRLLRRGALVAGRPCGDRDRTGHSDPGHRPRDNDLHFRGESAWLARAGRIQPRPAGFHPPGAPLSAQARPPAARRTGRAALPSATFPHVLPAVRQIPGPSAQHSQRQYHGGHSPPQSNKWFTAANWQVLQRYSITRTQGHVRLLERPPHRGFEVNC